MNQVRLRRDLLRWYRRRRRDLPWRNNPTPYRVWVSEIMLQQTTVAAVTPKYENFMRRFPTVAALAAASEQDVLSCWAGLGYYARARNLRAAAQTIMTRHGGVFPNRHDAVLALPGIGRYTAGAILSIAFQKPYPVVDGNVVRVLARLHGKAGRSKDAAFVQSFWPLADDLLARSAPGDWNQAMMELGATVCTPDAPQCAQCPLANECTAFKHGDQDKIPLPETRKKTIELRWTCLWVERGNHVLLWKRGNDERLLKGHWGLPESRHIAAKPGAHLNTITHTITCHALTINLRRAHTLGVKLPSQARWVPRTHLSKHLVSSLWTKLLR